MNLRRRRYAFDIHIGQSFYGRRRFVRISQKTKPTYDPNNIFTRVSTALRRVTRSEMAMDEKIREGN